MNRHGQALLEALCSLMVLGGAIALTLHLVQMAGAKVWLNHQLYQALICVAQGDSRLNCERQALRQTKISVTKDVQFSLWRMPKGWKGSYRWVGYAGARLNETMEISLTDRRQGFQPWH